MDIIVYGMYLAAFIVCASSLECYRCQYAESNSDNTLLENILGQNKGSRTCWGTPSSGKLQKCRNGTDTCLTVRTDLYLKISGFFSGNVNTRSVSKKCGPVGPMTQGCHAEPIDNFVWPFITSPGVTVDFEGGVTACTCKGDYCNHGNNITWSLTSLVSSLFICIIANILY